jgi:hypothetical protein
MTAVPDPEAVFTAALRAKTEVSGLVATRVGTRLGATFPAVRVAVVGGASRPTNNTGSPTMQWEAWGNTEAEAALLAKAIDGVADELAGTYTAGKIVASWRQGYYFHSRDPETNRDRYLGQIGLLTQ